MFAGVCFFDPLVPVPPQNATPEKGENKRPSSENTQRKAIFSPQAGRSWGQPRSLKLGGDLKAGRGGGL